MPLRELNLFVDKDSGRLVESFTSTLQAAPLKFVLGDSVPVNVRVLTADPSGTWQEVDLTGQTVRIAIGTPAGSPTVGTFTITYGGDETAELAYNATAAQVQTALNALASITSAGGVTVTKSTNGAYRVAFVTVGARTAFTTDLSNLYPTTGSYVTEAITGDASTREVAVIKLEVQPAAYAELTTTLPVAAATVTTVRDGSSGVSEIQTLEFDPVPYGGTYAITIASNKSAAIAWDATNAAIKSAIEGITGIGADKVTVTGTFPRYTVEFDASLTNVGAMTVDVSGLTVPEGRKGSVNTNTSGIIELLDGKARASGTLEIEIYDTTASTAFTVVQTSCEVVDDVIGNAPTPSSTGPTYPSSNQVVHFTPTITGLTGGTSNRLDSIPTVDLDDQARLVVVNDVSYLYKLEGTDQPEISPRYIRADDFAEGTNEKVWVLKGISSPLYSIAWNATLGRYRKMTLAGADGAETMTWSDL